MARTALFHELREDPAFIRLLPFRRHLPEDARTDAALFPEWDHDLFLQLHVFRCDLKADQLPLIHQTHIFHAVTAQFGEGRRALRGIPFFTDDQLSFTKIQCLLRKIVFQCLCPQLRH